MGSSRNELDHFWKILALSIAWVSGGLTRLSRGSCRCDWEIWHCACPRSRLMCDILRFLRELSWLATSLQWLWSGLVATARLEQHIRIARWVWHRRLRPELRQLPLAWRMGTLEVVSVQVRSSGCLHIQLERRGGDEVSVGGVYHDGMMCCAFRLGWSRWGPCCLSLLSCAAVRLLR